MTLRRRRGEREAPIITKKRDIHLLDMDWAMTLKGQGGILSHYPTRILLFSHPIPPIVLFICSFLFRSFVVSLALLFLSLLFPSLLSNHS